VFDSSVRRRKKMRIANLQARAQKPDFHLLSQMSFLQVKGH